MFFASAAAGLPRLPPDFWTAFPPSNATGWAPVGPPKTVPRLLSTEPAIVEFDWDPPPAVTDPVCLLAVIESPDDPIPAGNKVFDITALVPFEKRVGLKNMHVVASAAAMRHTISLQVSSGTARKQTIDVLPFRGGTLSIHLDARDRGIRTQGFEKVRRRASRGVNASFRLTAAAKGGALKGISVPKKGLNATLVLESPLRKPVTFSIVQKDGDSDSRRQHFHRPQESGEIGAPFRLPTHNPTACGGQPDPRQNS